MWTLYSPNTIPEVESLLQNITLEEKIGQMNLLTPRGGFTTECLVSENVAAKKVGEVGMSWRRAKEIAVNSTRLKIPLPKFLKSKLNFVTEPAISIFSYNQTSIPKSIL